MAEKFKEQAIIIRQEEIADDIYSMWLRTEEIAAHAKAGQFYLYIVMKEAGCFQDQSVSVKLIKRIMPSVWYTVKLEREQKSFPVCIPAEFLI